MPRTAAIRFCSALLLALMCTACKRAEFPKVDVVLYSSVDETYTLEIIKEFENDSGLKIKLISDSEAAKSTGLVNRLLAEQSRPVADVFWSGDPVRAAKLESEEIGRCYSGEELDQEAVTQGTAWRFRMIVVNTNREDTSLARPQSVLDLAKPEYAPHSCLANPQFGTTSMHLAVIYEQWGEDVGRKFLHDFSANGGKMVGSNGEVRRRVSSGEFIYGLTDSDDVSVALADGKSVDYVIADEKGLGVVGIPTRVVQITGAPNPEGGARLAAFLASAEVEEIMAKSTAAHFPVHEGVAGPEVFPFELKDVKMAEYSMERVMERMEEMQGEIDEWVSRQ